MKKLFLLIGCLALLTACQSPATPLPDTPTPLPSATATTAPTSTPTLIPTPVPLFFTDEFNSDLGSWVSFQTGGADAPSVNLKDDSLHIDFSMPNTWYYAIHTAHEYADVFVSAKASGAPTGSLGLICDYNEAKGWYEFNVTSDGTYSLLLGQWLAEGIAQYTPIVQDSSEYLKAGKLDYEIGLSCQGDTLFLHINGKLFRKVDVARYGLGKGKIGIDVASFDEVPASATFDWIKVEEPGG
jgi:hypothetical protein